MAVPALAVTGGDPLRKAPYPEWPTMSGGDLERVRKVLETSGWGGSSPPVASFESLFAQYHDAAFGVAVSSGTMALELAMHALGIGQGDEVIVPAHSFVATATAVCRVGGVPVFVDIEADTYNIDPVRVAEGLSTSTKAMIPVHFGGVMADMDRLGSVATDSDTVVIEDAAHAHGAEWFGTRAGGLGMIGTFSFQNSKAMTAGEGGIFITSDEGVAGKARSIADAGRLPGKGWFEHFEVGTNLRMTAMQAVLLGSQLERLQDQIRLRATNFGRFRRELEGIPGIDFQQAPPGATVQTRYIVPGRISESEFGTDRDHFVAAVQAEGVPVRPFYPHALYANPLFDRQPHRVLPCPVAEAATRNAFWLPMNIFMGTRDDAADAARAIAKVHEAYRSSGSEKTNGSPGV
ncbi:MAG: DegT/DnrJ/EryC1/StrS family aminotransferase [Acidobacteriia bacterium]|nr:DegT/DnrJ/EryC1/StrS family aminotransferase [Terriglobia bacterium]MYG03290.1 DegT/DnrJ/EryC1/StrS family aminotransferase [Terriglobia bacterium]MYK11169.1 DegT/DnrJ/EryC1/StrS family aminotransferase [Terriglobia bacterium]